MLLSWQKALHVRLRILSWREYPGLSRWAQCNHKQAYKREAGVSVLVGHKRGYRQSVEAESSKKMDSPVSPEIMQPCPPLSDV